MGYSKSLQSAQLPATEPVHRESVSGCAPSWALTTPEQSRIHKFDSVLLNHR